MSKTAATGESPTRSEQLHANSDAGKELPPYQDEERRHSVVADKLARKLSARQVQMIAIGTLAFPISFE
jgi:amino acid permease